MTTEMSRAEVAIPDSVIADWERQDSVETIGYQQAYEDIVAKLSAESKSTLRSVLNKSVKPNDSTEYSHKRAYAQARHALRVQRLTPYLDRIQTIVFAKNYGLLSNYSGSLPFNTCGLSFEGLKEWGPGAELCVLTLKDDFYGVETVLLEDRDGCIRDPKVSFDGDRLLFAWKKSPKDDDYHLYEMDVATRDVRQLTHGKEYADYEGEYMPNGDIVFTSTRSQNIRNCGAINVGNLFMCDKDGRFIRRIGYDQVATAHPALLPNGQVIYTRWEYNDRNHMSNIGLFVMNPDGSRQTEYYGNSSWWPVCLLQARGIPGTSKAMAVLCGHHSSASGKPAIIDPRKARNYPLGGKASEYGVQLICPVREYVYDESDLGQSDRWGGRGEQYQYPYPLSEDAMLVAYRTANPKPHYAGPPYPVRFEIFFVTVDGDRELLVSDDRLHCTQPYPFAPHPKPPLFASDVDYRKKTGAYYVQDIYSGYGLNGVPRGTVQKLRVVALDYVAAQVGRHGGMGKTTHGVPAPTSGSFMATPISRNWGAWDVKIVLGEAPVHEDGSAAFVIPARRPVYFQAINAKGHCVQTMRSWSTLMPGETNYCVGCHEHRNETPAATPWPTIAVRKGAQPLEPFHGIENQGFSYPKFVQPIFDEHCIRCHDEEHPRGINLKETPLVRDEDARKEWNQSYEVLTNKKLVSWITANSATNMLPPYADGSCKSRLISNLQKGHNDTSITDEEIEVVSCWIDLLIPHCGTHTERMSGDASVAKYDSFLDRRRKWEAEERQQIDALVREQHGIIARDDEP